MSDESNAEKLRISEGSVVWILGTTVEETSLLDPLPEGVEVVEARDEDDPDIIDAAVVFADDRLQLAEDFDEALPSSARSRSCGCRGRPAPMSARTRSRTCSATTAGPRWRPSRSTTPGRRCGSSRPRRCVADG